MSDDACQANDVDDAHSVTQSIERIWPQGGWLRRNWKVVMSTAATAIVTSGGWLAAKSFDAGMAKGESAELSKKLDSLTDEVQRFNEKIDSVQSDISDVKQDVAVMKSQVSDVHDWKERVTGVADTYTVPKFGHRAKQH